MTTLNALAKQFDAMHMILANRSEQFLKAMTTTIETTAHGTPALKPMPLGMQVRFTLDCSEVANLGILLKNAEVYGRRWTETAEKYKKEAEALSDAVHALYVIRNTLTAEEKATMVSLAEKHKEAMTREEEAYTKATKYRLDFKQAMREFRSLCTKILRYTEGFQVETPDHVQEVLNEYLR